MNKTNHVRGENNGRAKLTVDKVKAAREMWFLFKGATNPAPRKHNRHIVSIGALAKKNGVCATTMRLCLNKKTWAGVHVPR